MGGSNGMFEPGNVNVAAPYFISGRTGVLAGLAAAAPVARLAQLGMIDPRLANGALQPTPIRVSQVRLKIAPQAAPVAGATFEVLKGIGTPASTGTGAAAHAAQRRKTTGYPAIALTETHLWVAGTDAIGGGAFTPSDATGPLDWASVGLNDVSAGASNWTPIDLCPTQLEAGECLEVRAVTALGAGTCIVLVAFDFLR